jgi:hypothetical protein
MLPTRVVISSVYFGVTLSDQDVGRRLFAYSQHHLPTGCRCSCRRCSGSDWTIDRDKEDVHEDRAYLDLLATMPSTIGVARRSRLGFPVVTVLRSTLLAMHDVSVSPRETLAWIY